MKSFTTKKKFDSTKFCNSIFYFFHLKLPRVSSIIYSNIKSKSLLVKHPIEIYGRLIYVSQQFQRCILVKMLFNNVFKHFFCIVNHFHKLQFYSACGGSPRESISPGGVSSCVRCMDC